MDDYKVPTRKEAIEAARALISGVKTASEVARWAERINYPENVAYQEKLSKADPALAQLLSDLGMADMPGDNPSENLYGKEDYQDWLDDFFATSKGQDYGDSEPHK